VIADACGRALRRSLPAVAAAIALAMLGGAAWAGRRWVTSSSRFAISEIVIRGTHQVNADELRAALPVRAGENVFADLAAIARAARTAPRGAWIASAEVHRILPHTITVDVREYTAAAVVDLGDLYLVDTTGRPFKRAAIEGGEADGLPIITGIGRASYLASRAATSAKVRAVIAAYERWRTADRPAIAEIHVDPHGAVALHTHDPSIAIQLGPLGGELDARMRTFDAAWLALSDAERTRARAIHLGARPDHVTVAFASD
jgi:cell division septal protein FtsQ